MSAESRTVCELQIKKWCGDEAGDNPALTLADGKSLPHGAVGVVEANRKQLLIMKQRRVMSPT